MHEVHGFPHKPIQTMNLSQNQGNNYALAWVFWFEIWNLQDIQVSKECNDSQKTAQNAGLTLKQKLLSNYDKESSWPKLTFFWIVAIFDTFLLEYKESKKKVIIYTFYTHIWLLETPKLNSKKIGEVNLDPKSKPLTRNIEILPLFRKCGHASWGSGEWKRWQAFQNTLSDHSQTKCRCSILSRYTCGESFSFLQQSRIV